MGLEIDSEWKERLPCIFRTLAHRALNAIIIVAYHLSDILPLWVMTALSCLILLEAVKVESMAALLERDSCFVVWIENVLKLQILHDHFIPLDMRIFLGHKTSQSHFRCQT